MEDIWNRKTFCLVTGASRGIGRTIAIQFSEKIGPGSVILLLARDGVKLQETKESILKANPDVDVYVKPVDLGEQDSNSFSEILSSVLKDQKTATNFEIAIIVHNAGSVGDVAKKTTEYDDTVYLKRYFSENLISVITLNSAFLQAFKDLNVKKVIVNITSLLGIQAAPFFGTYCTGKAARDMLFQVMAEEDPSLLILNYAPGPVDTDMFTSCENSSESSVRSQFKSIRGQDRVLTCEKTVARLVQILQERKFKSGQHVDYYDDLVY